MSKCQHLKPARDHDKTINEKDLKHVKDIKEILKISHMLVFKMDLLLMKCHAKFCM